MEFLFLALLVILMASALGSGYPVAFALPGSAILTIALAALAGWIFAGNTDAYFHQGGPAQWLSAGVTNFRGIYWEVERDTLIAIPLFVFMGIMLQRSKIAEDLLVTMAQLFGPVPGGLGISVVFVGALLAATTGILGATVVAMGLISLPAMLRNNYSKGLATGTIAASGTLGQVIPPSIVLIILADQLASAVDQAGTARKTLYKATTGSSAMPSEFAVVSTSAGDMFLGAFIPGLILVALYMLFILIIALLRPKMAPAVPVEQSFDRRFVGKVLLTLIPPLTLIFVVLGSIILGVATVNQAGAIGAVGATIMAGYRLREGHNGAYIPAILAVLSLLLIAFTLAGFDTNVKSETSSGLGLTLAFIGVAGLVIAVVWSGWRTFKIEETLNGVMVETAKTTSLVFIILLGAAMLTAAFRAFGGEDLVRDFLTSLPGGFWMQFTIVMMVIFMLGFFLDYIEIAVVVVPIVAPILLADPSANVTAVWLGVMIGLNIQTSFLTPPFGFALFYLRGVAPAVVRTVDMYKGVIPFIGLQLIALVIVGMVPPLVNYLPNRISMLSETAPPPLNPRLQYCIEQIVFTEYETDNDRLNAAITTARGLDLSYVPERVQDAVRSALDGAESVPMLVRDIRQAEVARDGAVEGYAPLHASVRRIEAQISKLQDQIKERQTELDRLQRRDPENTAIAGMGQAIADREFRLQQLEAQIPENWQADNGAFSQLQNGVADARKKYRNTVDDAYNNISELIEVLQESDGLATLVPALTSFQGKVAASDADTADALKDEYKDLSRALSRQPDMAHVVKEFKKVQRAIRARSFDLNRAQSALQKAADLTQQEASWRSRAATELLPGLQTYEAAIRNNIGIRLQEKLPREMALEVASCNSDHRDISLSF